MGISLGSQNIGRITIGSSDISEVYIGSTLVWSATFKFNISGNVNQANLRTLAVSAGWNQSSKVEATIASGVKIYSSATGTPGLTVNGSWPSGVILINKGTISGMGGA